MAPRNTKEKEENTEQQKETEERSRARGQGSLDRTRRKRSKSRTRKGKDVAFQDVVPDLRQQIESHKSTRRACDLRSTTWECSKSTRATPQNWPKPVSTSEQKTKLHSSSKVTFRGLCWDIRYNLYPEANSDAGIREIPVFEKVLWVPPTNGTSHRRMRCSEGRNPEPDRDGTPPELL
jgi:hypothetical protein